MAKLVKGDNIQNIITDGDVIITSPSKIGKTLNEVLNEQQSDIDRLKSNVKYIYAYGGVGGSGSGGSGTGEKPVNVFIELNGKEICKDGDNAVVLNGKGNYTLKIKISNAGEKNYYMGYSTIGSVDDDNMGYELKGENRYKVEINIPLNENGTLNIKIIDSEDNLIGYYFQNYIVEPDIFNVTLNYTDRNGETHSLSKPYECFVDDQFRFNRHFKIDYSIFLLNYSDAKVECQIDGGVELIYEDSDSIKISLEKGENCGVLIGGESILQDKYHGTYTLKAKLSYKIQGEVIIREKTLTFSVVPSGLYINVRTNGDVLYDDIKLLENDILNGVNRYISQGSSLMMYGKVFEGAKEGDGITYDIVYTAYDAETENGVVVNWKPIGVEERDNGIKEQEESIKGVSLTFPTEGIKKIVISTEGKKNNIGITQYFEKYVYVKKFDNQCNWFNSNRHKNISDSYFKANQGDNTYSKDEYGNYTFPPFSSGNGILSLIKSSDIITIDQSNLIPSEALLCTVITFGLQVSNINSENAKIVDMYIPSSASPIYSLRLGSLFSNDGSNKIAIPTEVLDKNDNSKYHLVQIIRNLSNLENGVTPVYEDSLYIDGLLESSNVATTSSPLKVSQIILQNINACYNLINIQYFSYENNEGNRFNPDAYAYQYWLAYKEKYVNSSLSENRLTDGEFFFINGNMDRISFDGTNVVVDPSIIMDIARISDLPTVVFSYDCQKGDKKEISAFMEDMWMGRTNGDTTFGRKEIDLYWIPSKTIYGKLEEYEVIIPELTDYKDVPITTNWELELQGTSTMRNRIKNYSLRINSQSSNGSEKVLFSPKFDIDKPETFLPDVEWTIKADIADSAHANNTSIGKFVNKVCSKIDTNIADISDNAKPFIKNTLEGIPVLLYFMCEGIDENGQNAIKAYYFGIYNFNLGRNSYYNLGYNGGIADEKTKTSDFMRVFNNIQNSIKNNINNGKYQQANGFSFAVGECKLSRGITVGEIQENAPQFDFHQYNSTLLFKDEDDSNNNCMFGSEKKVTTSNFNDSKAVLIDLVKGVAKAGKFCFMESGRENDFVTSRYFTYDEDGKPIYEHDEVCLNRYLEEKIPDPIYQIQYVNNRMTWVEDHECDKENINISDLKKLIIEYELPNGETNVPLLDYTSASEYYIICMAFGMVDSVLKNMNLKNFRSIDEGPTFYCAFYDMDCALEENNAGLEDITYLAATDYWYSPIDSNNKVGLVEKKNDYWNSDAGSGFDFTSSYLLAVVKYAKSIFENLPKGEEKYATQLSNFPQNFWAKLRKDGGELQSADHFMKNYFKSGITSTFEYLASLNYRVKYLYRGKSFDSDGGYTEKYLANSGSFNGSRKIKVKNWLKKRLRFLDMMMNVNCLSIPISDSSMLKIPSPTDFKDGLLSNPDITILHSAFNTSEANKAQSNFSGEISICAPTFTPFIFSSGSSTADMYLLPGGVKTDGEYRPNKIFITTRESENTYFYGSGMFTSVDKIESTFTEYNSIVSDNLEKFEYGGSPVKGNNGKDFLINAKSIREINLNIPKMGGNLNIHEDCISVEKINIAGSNFYGTFSSFPNLKEVDITGVVTTSSDNGITITNSEYLTGEKIYISGKDKDNKTTLGFLNISGVTGNFRCENTNIEKISISNKNKRSDIDFSPEKLSEFSIYGDSVLRKLELNGFRKVSITSCNKLEELSIGDDLEELYINLAKIDKDNVTSALKFITLGGTNGTDGVFDFTKYPHLKKVTLINCDHLVQVKLPDHDVETDGMNNNINLKWIDTGILPAFLDKDNITSGSYPEGDGVIEGVGDYINDKFPIYSKGAKLILCSDGVFSNCPNYAMLRSDWDKSYEMIGMHNNIAYTNITVSENCTSLVNTFYMSGYLSERTYVNDYGQTVTEPLFNMNTAIRFIEKCVPDNVKEKITSLSGCFRGCGKGIEYTDGDAASEISNNSHLCPSLTKYRSLIDISGMFYGTGVKFISKQLLDLPYDKNITGNTLYWSDFINNMYSGIDISVDALENISYRLTSYSNIKFTLYEYDSENYKYNCAGSESKMFKIKDFFHHRFLEDGNSDSGILPFNNISSINSLNFGDQYIDFRGMFELFPNVGIISNFLNGKLRKYNIEGLLSPCKNITSIVNSFCDDDVNDITNPQVINLFTFFNWIENTTTGVTNLFEGNISGDYFSNGFRIKKTISYNDFKTVLNKIVEIAQNSKDLTRLTNIFSYCTITGYKDVTEEDREIKFENTLHNIKNISNLFENCTSDYTPKITGTTGNSEKGVYTGGVLKIGRSFFEKLPNFTIAQRTFANTHLSTSLTYDYFCKRGNIYIDTPVLLSEDQKNVATLYECIYSSDIINLKECFYNVKFVDCKNWFDEDDNVITINRNYIKSGDIINDERGAVYYKDNNGTYEKYVLDNDVLDDCLDNYTDFVSDNLISNYTWYNHDLQQDFSYYGNLKGGKKPFDLISSTNNTMQKTHCCLPPDFLYGCSNSAVIDGIFANTNIVGVIPRNLTKKIKSQSIPNIFRNVNIMPNLEYYYDVKGSFDGSILNNIDEKNIVDIDGGIGEKYCVVFRDETGILKKRKPIDSDRNLGQFVYVPHNFTTSSSLMNAFNFRYNLPMHWNMPGKFTDENGKVVEYYKTTKEFNDSLQNGLSLEYHTQYYFTTDKSVKWDIIRDAKSVFISNNQDIDFSNINAIGKERDYYDGSIEVNDNHKNTWTLSSGVSSMNGWVSNIIEKFYIDLNLCGKKNEYNMLEDYGCPIEIKNREVQLDNFISGILTIFLNGRVFYDDFAINDLTTTKHKNSSSSYVIDYYGFGKNIILPKYDSSPLDENFVFITSSNYNVIYFDFMINDNEILSKQYYKQYLGIGEKINNNTNLNEDKNKYTFQ